MSKLLSIIALLLLAPAAHAQTSESAEAGARAVFEKNLAAIEARDADAYLACYLQSDRLVRNGFGGVGLGFDQLAASVGEGWPDRFEAREMQVHALTEDVVYGQYRYRVTYGDDVQEGISERVFVRTEEGWRIAVTTAFGAPAGALPPIESEPAAASPGDGKDR